MAGPDQQLLSRVAMAVGQLLAYLQLPHQLHLYHLLALRTPEQQLHRAQARLGDSQVRIMAAVAVAAVAALDLTVRLAVPVE